MWGLVLFVYPFFCIVPERQLWHSIFLLKFFFVASELWIASFTRAIIEGEVNQIQMLQTRILNAMSKKYFPPFFKTHSVLYKHHFADSLAIKNFSDLSWCKAVGQQ